MSKINVLGASCIDILVKGIDKEQFFSGKYKAEEIRTYFGGDGLNETLVLKFLGQEVSFNTLLGNDVYGKMILSHMEEEGILTDLCVTKDDIDTYLSLVFIDKNGERTFVGADNGSLRLYDLPYVKIDDDCEIVSFASLFISKKLNNESYTSLFHQIKESGKILCADCSNTKHDEDARDLPYLSFIDHFFCNETEAKALCHNEDIYECEKILYDMGIKDVIIKLGSSDMCPSPKTN